MAKEDISTKDNSAKPRTDLTIILLKDWEMSKGVFIEKNKTLTVEASTGERLVSEGTAQIVKNKK